jgi:uncharacterized protein YjiS (DUF1127 family)
MVASLSGAHVTHPSPPDGRRRELPFDAGRARPHETQESAMTPARTPVAAAAPAPVETAKVGFLAIAGALVRRWVNRQRVSRLLEMDDRMLRDIGLRRADVHDALVAREADPSTWLAGVAARSRSEEFDQLRASLRSNALVSARKDVDPRVSLAA